jgi:predicted methyltransferase
LITDQITTIVKKEISPYIHEGYIAVDLTAGNGNDTCFLAEAVGKSGKVYAFDVQAIAIENTKRKLEDKQLQDRVSLIHDGHENIGQYINRKINVAMLNLGYLPSGDKAIITRPETTIIAINKVIEMLEIGGVMSIVVYYGHDGGVREKDVVENLLRNLDEKNIDIMTISYLNRKNAAPVIHLLHKRTNLDKF